VKRTPPARRSRQQLVSVKRAQEACERLAEELMSSREKFSRLHPAEAKEVPAVIYRCLPDTVDPRGPKVR